MHPQSKQALLAKISPGPSHTLQQTIAMSAPSIPPPDASSRVSLEGMAPEILNRIYRMVLVRIDPFTVCIGDGSKSTFGALMLVNKRINKEASSIFFGENKFIVSTGQNRRLGEPSLDAFLSFIKWVQPRNLAATTKLDITLHVPLLTYHSPYGVVGSVSESNLLAQHLKQHTTGLKRISLNWAPKRFRGFPSTVAIRDVRKDLAQALETISKVGRLEEIVLDPSWLTAWNLRLLLKDIVVRDSKLGELFMTSESFFMFGEEVTEKVSLKEMFPDVRLLTKSCGRR